ncbi:DUF4294 domain-containing protein [Abyssalbus ytuae]|uniref:DUF4294 domain-containing protein n=1 Tax=Abyssalbus ytuae TaxID=2926907 RepID=A0A9E6ZM49_9FLAO|nr:DUF4294 domain-containing protein [Abyssalbus ytuae]UOB17194.1 DUF4294 domain-containing protein [Abyssalbus ytuae]
MKKILYIIFFINCFLFSQEKKGVKDSLQLPYYFFEEDTIPRSYIDLDPVVVFQPLKFPSKEDKYRYYILRRKTIKVYPYAKLASERLEKLNDTLSKIKKKSKRRKYTRKLQKYIEDEFSAELKKLTRTEGQILVKLIYRQTGATAFDLVKELRNGWRAFWYNTTASLFKISLKERYDPQEVHEDYLIEDILQRAFASGKLIPQSSVLNFDYSSLTNKWKEEKKSR